MTPVYNAAYFIAKFEAIPEELWFSGDYRHPENPDCRCVRGHCGEGFGAYSPELDTLLKLGRAFFRSTSVECVCLVNDGDHDSYQQPTPKKRVLAWLRDAQEAGL